MNNKTEKQNKNNIVLFGLIMLIMIFIFYYFYVKKSVPIIEPIQSGGNILKLNNTISEFNKLLNI